MNYEEIREPQNKRIMETIIPAIDDVLADTRFFGENAHVVKGTLRHKGQTEQYPFGWLYLRESTLLIAGTKRKKTIGDYVCGREPRPREIVTGRIKITHGYDVELNKRSEGCTVSLLAKDFLGKYEVATANETPSTKEPTREEIKTKLSASLKIHP